MNVNFTAELTSHHHSVALKKKRKEARERGREEKEREKGRKGGRKGKKGERKKRRKIRLVWKSEQAQSRDAYK